MTSNREAQATLVRLAVLAGAQSHKDVFELFNEIRAVHGG